MRPDDTATVSISFEGFNSLTVAEVWPDGPPESWDAQDVLDALTTNGLLRGIEDWNLSLNVLVTVEQPNPYYTQPSSLLPEMAPPRLLLSRAEDWT
jgi:hypothetical protein